MKTGARSLVFLLVTLLTIAPHPARADDAGPSDDIRVLRHDAPILLAASAPGTPVIDSVVVWDGDVLHAPKKLIYLAARFYRVHK